MNNCDVEAKGVDVAVEEEEADDEAPGEVRMPVVCGNATAVEWP